jgi:hypothetical protein
MAHYRFLEYEYMNNTRHILTRLLTLMGILIYYSCGFVLIIFSTVILTYVFMKYKYGLLIDNVQYSNTVIIAGISVTIISLVTGIIIVLWSVIRKSRR